MRFIDLTNRRFGLLVVLQRTEDDKNKNRMWLCQCDCGNKKVVGGRHLTSGKTISCGCVQNDGHSNYRHGKRHTKIYRIWGNMKHRCHNQNYKKYKDYGGRGISVCDEWRTDFKAFYDYVSQLPHYGEDGYSLDRIDNDGNYEPGNVRWATAQEQAVNRRSNKNIPEMDDFTAKRGDTND